MVRHDGLRIKPHISKSNCGGGLIHIPVHLNEFINIPVRAYLLGERPRDFFRNVVGPMRHSSMKHVIFAKACVVLRKCAAMTLNLQNTPTHAYGSVEFDAEGSRL
jgi:hypothetical protein